MKWINRLIENIEKDWGLKVYGALLFTTHLWTFFYWRRGGFFLSSQSTDNAEPLCFPFFPNCDLFRESLSNNFWQVTLYTYAILSVVGFLLFFNNKYIKLAWWLLLFETLLKLGIHLSNYNFMGNYHYMIYFVTVVFLFFPQPSKTIRYLIFGFYMAAGFLKLHPDWLSAANMISTPLLKGVLLKWSLYYVVFLELLFVFGLMHKNRWIRWGTLLQFLGFHLFSWHIVGFYYPMVMFSLLSIFLIEEYKWLKGESSIEPYWQNFFTGRESKSTYFVLGFFTVLQILPFILSSDSSMSGVARLSSLNMFDSKVQCQVVLIAETKDATAHLTRFSKNLGVRLQCDPIVFLNQAQQICRQAKADNDFESLHLAILSKRVTDQDYQKIFDIKNFCQHKAPLWAELWGQVQ